MTPAADADTPDFGERYDRLLRELTDLLDEIPTVENEPHGPSGLRIRFPPSESEVRITPLEDQALVHFVFGHAALGSRAEHHASRPFGDSPPDVTKLLRQLLAFLTEGVEPRWLSRRPPIDPSAVREPDREDVELELPLD